MSCESKACKELRKMYLRDIEKLEKKVKELEQTLARERLVKQW